MPLRNWPISAGMLVLLAKVDIALKKALSLKANNGRKGS